MKRLFYATGATLIVGIGLFFACTMNEDLGEKKTQVENLMMPKEYAEIGEKHNEGLEAAFNEFRKFHQVQKRSGQATRKLSQDECLAVMGKGLDRYLRKEGYETDAVQTRAIKSENTGTAKKDYASVLTPEVKPFMDKIRKALDDKDLNAEKLLAKLNAINIEAQSTLSETDLIAVYAGTSTCYHSYLYWKENYKKWVIGINQPELLSVYDDQTLNAFTAKDGKLVPPSMKKDWWDDAWSSIGETWDDISDTVSDWWNNDGGKETVIADAGAAVAGAIKGGSAGSVGGPAGVVGGAAGTALEEGATASIATAIGEYLGKNL